jgi:heat-inducible transcriptional repressor
MPSVDDRPDQGTPAPGAALDARKAAILEAVVAEYIGTAQPVGSQHVASAPGVNVSSATVRSEMVALEHEGYLIQPHTSAGRIPTDKGYRFFVDHLAAPGILGPVQRQKVHRFFDQVHGEIEELLEQTTGLLSDLTLCAAVVVGPSHGTATVRSVQLVGLAPRVALFVVVLSDGSVEKRSIEFDHDVADDLLGAAGGHLLAHVHGRPLASPPVLSPAGADVDAVVRVAAQALEEMARDPEPEQVFVGGPSRLAVAFDAVETVRSVLGILEQQLVVVSLLRDVLERGLSVAIGAEHGYEPLASCAVVVAPLSVSGLSGGAVGLLGPTRMNYPQAMAVAHVVGERLGERIGDNLGITSLDATAEPAPTKGRPGREGRRRARS